MIIETPRLELRPLAENDAEAIWPFVSDPAISRFMSWHPHANLEQTRAFIADVLLRMKAESTVAWVVVERASGEICGLVSLLAIMRTHRALRYDKAELAYWVGAPFQGRGYATEACFAVLQYAYQAIGLNKITVAHDRENDASRALIVRLGFREVGTEYKHFCKDGRWIDHVIYELLSADFRMPQ
jgi:RimJ/RimL family protein N-acetyltransferase